MELSKVMEERRSVRHYNDKKLDGLKILKLQTLNYCFIGNKKYKNLSNKTLNFEELKKESLILNTINPIQTSLLNNMEDNYSLGQFVFMKL